MAGIYIHIPFCKKACHYCNFHFSTSLKYKDAMIQALLKELELRQDYLQNESIETIYLGGGTPSVLDVKDIEQMFTVIQWYYNISSLQECTLEANPDDLDKDYISDLKSIGVNRLSIGVQSFDPVDLEWMNRSHSAQQAHDCIHDAYTAGIDNLSIDLIFGSPTTSDNIWSENLELATRYKIKHLSCYALTVEDKTPLKALIDKGKSLSPDDDRVARQFHKAQTYLKSNDYLHYEISNYCLDQYQSRHNSNYWNQVPYIGIGPSAHSFNGKERQWNIAHNQKYINALTEDTIPYELEVLSTDNLYNEYIMTKMRTSQGCQTSVIKGMGEKYERHFLESLSSLIDEGKVIRSDDYYVVVDDYKIISDQIIGDLFI